MSLSNKDVSNIEKKLEIYDKIFEKIFQRFDSLDIEIKGKKTKKRIVEDKYLDNDKIYLSIAGFSKAASLDN